jgi:hypothetical protein
MSEAAPPQAAVEPAVATPQAMPAPAGFSPLHAQLARSASAMGNHAFTRWADGPGSRSGVAVPPLSAHEAWGPILAREPAAPAAEAESEQEDDAEEPIEVKGMQFGKSLLDGVIPAAGGDLTKTFTTNFDKKADFGPYSMMVPLMPPFVTAKFGAAGAMGAKANASLTLTGTNIADAAFGQAKKQQVTASGKGDASGTIAGSLVAGVMLGAPGLLNMGIYGQGTLALNVVGDGSFDGSIKRLKPKKGGGSWGPWTGDLSFKAKLKGSLIAEASGYLEYQVLWIFRDQFAKFKIGKWTLAEAGIDIAGTMGPDRPFQVTIKPFVGPLMQPGHSKEVRERTKPERELAEKMARDGAAGVPPGLSRTLARVPDPPPDDDEAQPAAGGAPAAPAAAAPEAAGGGAAPAAEPAGPEAAPAGPEAAGGGAAPANAAGGGANAAVAAIAGVDTQPTPSGGPAMVTLEGDPKIEEG